jgi:hypothetical protein
LNPSPRPDACAIFSNSGLAISCSVSLLQVLGQRGKLSLCVFLHGFEVRTKPLRHLICALHVCEMIAAALELRETLLICDLSHFRFAPARLMVQAGINPE